MSAAGPKSVESVDREPDLDIYDKLRRFDEKIKELEARLAPRVPSHDGGSMSGREPIELRNSVAPAVPTTGRRLGRCRFDSFSHEKREGWCENWVALPEEDERAVRNAAEPPTESISDRNARIDEEIRNIELGREDDEGASGASLDLGGSPGCAGGLCEEETDHGND